MQKTNVKTKNKSALINFAQKNSKFYAIKGDTVFFVNRMKLEEILSLLCLLCEFNEKFMYVQNGDITLWLKENRLLVSELLYEISDMSAQYINRDI